MSIYQEVRDENNIAKLKQRAQQLAGKRETLIAKIEALDKAAIDAQEAAAKLVQARMALDNFAGDDRSLESQAEVDAALNKAEEALRTNDPFGGSYYTF